MGVLCVVLRHIYATAVGAVVVTTFVCIYVDLCMYDCCATAAAKYNI